jgi:hypothetical protein
VPQLIGARIIESPARLPSSQTVTRPAFCSGGRTFGAHFVKLRIGKAPAQMHPMPKL